METWLDGMRYEGEFHDDKRHGQGVMRWPDGSSYNVSWQADLPHGRGVFTDPDGRSFEGEWHNGVEESDRWGLPDTQWLQ